MQTVMLLESDSQFQIPSDAYIMIQVVINLWSEPSSFCLGRHSVEYLLILTLRSFLLNLEPGLMTSITRSYTGQRIHAVHNTAGRRGSQAAHIIGGKQQIAAMANLAMTLKDFQTPKNGLFWIHQVENGFEDSRFGLKPVKTGDASYRLKVRLSTADICTTLGGA